ncbi:type II asparaginase [Corallococcus sp. bb12-1]|uniref:type II asparaginase n=1 Tax=Corallococcus sp. bb12-1 TaxID=2996784 RepID=UPI002271BE1E|nr:type II asparaginase [Corallococcus sp. bb12-1]MCY1041212.1 type II asparaginase [Corallococcus sp. bb12-1]
MKMRRQSLACTLAAILALLLPTLPSAQPAAKAPTAQGPKAKVRIVATGGTIAGAQGDSGSYGYKSGAFKVEDLIQGVPHLDTLARLSGEQVVNIGSQDMNDTVWLKLAARVNALLASPDVDGIVVTHGTDTLEETAYFLDLVVKSDKPVVLVGSMRPATAISADGPANLYNGVAVAASPEARGRGVLVVINDEIHAARNVTKMNTTNVETFHSPNRGPAGLVNTGAITWMDPVDKKHTKATEFSVKGLKTLPRVDILYAHANMSPDLIEAAVDNGAQGLVIAGVGDGNMTQASIDTLEKVQREHGVAVVRSSRVPTGLVLRDNEINDDQKGFVASGEFNPPKSRVLLQLALTKTCRPERIQRMFDEY